MLAMVHAGERSCLERGGVQLLLQSGMYPEAGRGRAKPGDVLAPLRSPRPPCGPPPPRAADAGKRARAAMRGGPLTSIMSAQPRSRP